MNRYFIVSYMLKEVFSMTYGHIACNTHDGMYINLEAFSKLLSKENVIITNIIELNENDYNHFIYKENKNEK